MRTLAAALVLTLAVITPAHAGPEAAFGRWLTQNGNGHIEVTPCGDSACGTIVWGQGGPSTDTKNPDHALRSRPLLGARIMEGYHRAAAGWVDGRVYDPERGQTFRSELLPQPDGTLKVKGCFGFYCETQTWRRVS